MLRPKKKKPRRRVDAGSLPERTDGDEASVGSEATSGNLHPQAKRRRRKRTRDDNSKRDAAFVQDNRGRPKGSRLPISVDPDRFAIAMVYCGGCYMGLPQYHAAYLTLALTSENAIDPHSISDALQLSGGPRTATLKGAASGLVAKCTGTTFTPEEKDWIASSSALLAMLIKAHRAPAVAPSLHAIRLKAIFDELSVHGSGAR